MLASQWNPKIHWDSYPELCVFRAAGSKRGWGHQHWRTPDASSQKYQQQKPAHSRDQHSAVNRSLAQDGRLCSHQQQRPAVGSLQQLASNLIHCHLETLALLAELELANSWLPSLLSKRILDQMAKNFANHLNLNINLHLKTKNSQHSSVQRLVLWTWPPYLW